MSTTIAAMPTKTGSLTDRHLGHPAPAARELGSTGQGLQGWWIKAATTTGRQDLGDRCRQFSLISR